MTERRPAEVFPPGEFVKDELDERGWTQADLADITGCPPRLISEVIAGKRSVTPATARKLGEAFGTDPQMWLNLEGAYRLHRTGGSDGTVAKRAKLFEKAPIREMMKRGWIEQTENPVILEQQLLEFFETNCLEERLEFFHAARKSTSYDDELLPSQRAWLFRARKLARAVSATPFNAKRFRVALASLRLLTHSPAETRKVPRVLADCGIRLVVLEHLNGTRIDGACFWLDRRSPVVALSLRYDRIDFFWHTLMHELGHVKNKDGLESKPGSLDIDLLGNQVEDRVRPEFERAADDFAVNILVDQSELEGFIARTKPLYSRTKVRNFSRRMAVHPGIVVGQLQYRREISYAHSRDMLERIRHYVTQSTLTDGWGAMPPPNL